MLDPNARPSAYRGRLTPGKRDESALFESARFLARQDDALRRADESASIADIDARIAVLGQAINDFLRA